MPNKKPKKNSRTNTPLQDNIEFPICKQNGWFDTPSINAHLKSIIKCLDELHHEWITNNNIDALIEANYLTDYYCSNILIACDPNEITIPSKKQPEYDIFKLKRKMEWTDNVSFDVFKDKISYKTGLTKVMNEINALVTLSIHFIKKDGLNIRIKNNIIDWTSLQTATVKKIHFCVNFALSKRTTYLASGLGLYRLVNIHNNETDSENLPCSCICNSLLFIAIIIKLGFPPNKAFIHLQATENAFENRKKQTHWAVSCEDISSKIMHNYFVIDDKPGYFSIHNVNIASSLGFSKYTRDIIIFYEFFSINFKAPKSGDRIKMLKKLRELYNKTFIKYSSDFMTPVENNLSYNKHNMSSPKPTQMILNEIAEYYYEKHASSSVHDRNFVLLKYHNDKLPQKLREYIKQYPTLEVFYSRLFDRLKKRVEKFKEINKRDLYIDINTICRGLKLGVVPLPTKPVKEQTKPKPVKEQTENDVDLKSKTVVELRKIVSDLKIAGRSALKLKQELIDAIMAAQNTTKTKPKPSKSPPKPTNVIRIPKKDQYDELFKITLDENTYRDIPKNISKWVKPILIIFAMHFEIKDYKKMKKPELYNLIKDRIVFE